MSGAAQLASAPQQVLEKQIVKRLYDAGVTDRFHGYARNHSGVLVAAVGGQFPGIEP